MTSVLMPACPFCGGPPMPSVVDPVEGGAVEAKDEYGDDGAYVSARVFCHECGARGPHHDVFVYDLEDFRNAEAEGVRLWIERDARHRELYEAGAPERLNEYPRPPR